MQRTPSTAKQETKFSFDIDTPKILALKKETKFIFDLPEANFMEEKSVEKLMEEQIEALKLEARRRNSYKAAAQSDFAWGKHCYLYRFLL